ncbi:MAG: hypothetical protein ACM3MK_03400 [Chitinophagales bacterium]
MKFFRIQEKVVSLDKIMVRVSRVLELRAQGLSQQEVAERLSIDRTFVSRLETLGELRKGRSIGVIGFPISNKAELESLLNQEGVDFIFLMTEEERNSWVASRNGAEVINELMDLIARVRAFDVVVLLASDLRLKLMKALLDKEVITIEIGESPLKEDRRVDTAELLKIIRLVKGPKKARKPKGGKDS